MIKFFRKIRKKLIYDGKLKNYSFYAVGEILLVIVGILIALQINNWNNIRNEEGRIKEYANALILDLEEDVAMVNVILRQAKKITSRIDSLSQYVQDRKIQDISNIDILTLTWVKSNRPYKWNRATLEELKNSGSLRYIKNNYLKKKIAEYDAFTHHLDEDFENDKAQSEIATQLISQVVDINYPNINDLDKVLLDPANPTVEFDLVYSSPQYERAKDYNLSLITNDIRKVKIAVSGFIRLKFNLRIRTEIELPQLLNDAEVIISLLKKTYLD